MPLAPFNLQAWVNENRQHLKPPVGNKPIWAGQFLVMVVGGPNARTDYHINPGEELFYQIEGDMTLRIMECENGPGTGQGKPRDVEIREGEMFLLPAHVHHSPQRRANTVGLVIERKRQPGELDGFAWYCDKCHTKLHEAFLLLKSIVNDLPPLFDRFWSSENARTCKNCGTVMPLPENRK